MSELKCGLCKHSKRVDELYQENLTIKANMESNRQECCACSKERDELQSQVAVLRGALETLVEKYISNKGTKDQFVACITPPHGTPVYWKKAIKALEGVERLKGAIKQ